MDLYKPCVSGGKSQNRTASMWVQATDATTTPIPHEWTNMELNHDPLDVSQ